MVTILSRRAVIPTENLVSHACCIPERAADFNSGFKRGVELRRIALGLNGVVQCLFATPNLVGRRFYLFHRVASKSL